MQGMHNVSPPPSVAATVPGTGARGKVRAHCAFLVSFRRCLAWLSPVFPPPRLATLSAVQRETRRETMGCIRTPSPSLQTRPDDQPGSGGPTGSDWPMGRLVRSPPPARCDSASESAWKLLEGRMGPPAAFAPAAPACPVSASTRLARALSNACAKKALSVVERPTRQHVTASTVHMYVGTCVCTYLDMYTCTPPGRNGRTNGGCTCAVRTRYSPLGSR